MKNLIRKFIVRTCALTYRVGKAPGSVPRISMLFIALFFLSAVVNIANNTVGELTWYNYIFLATLAVLVWIGFDWFGAGYFELWPAQFDELDDYQKYTFSRAYFHELTEDQAEEIVKIIDNHSNWF